jgi:hypothetical protein
MNRWLDRIYLLLLVGGPVLLLLAMLTGCQPVADLPATNEPRAMATME